MNPPEQTGSLPVVCYLFSSPSSRLTQWLKPTIASMRLPIRMESPPARPEDWDQPPPTPVLRFAVVDQGALVIPAVQDHLRTLQRNGLGWILVQTKPQPDPLPPGLLPLQTWWLDALQEPLLLTTLQDIELMDRVWKQFRQTVCHHCEPTRLKPLGMMAALLAHEINNPNTFATTNLLLLQRLMHQLQQALSPWAHLSAVPLAQAVADQLSWFQQKLAHADGLVSDALDGLLRVNALVQQMGAFSSGAQAPFAAVDVGASLVHAVMQVRRMKSQHNHIQLVWQVEHNAELWGCEPLLHQAFLNLLTNAVDAMTLPPALPNQPAVLTLGMRLAANGTHRLQVWLQDTGCGMDEATQTRLFEPFFTTKPYGHGTGLGMMVVQEAANAHGAQLTVDSTPGQGTTVQLDLPILQPLSVPAGLFQTTGWALNDNRPEEGRPYGNTPITA